MPQLASNRTTRCQNSLKQEVARVPKVKRFFVMPDGQVKEEKDMAPEDMRRIAQRIVDELTPLLYEAVMKDLQKEQEAVG